MISSITVTVWPLVSRVTTSLLSLAWPRTLTLLATTVAGPGTSGTVFNSAPASFFFAAGFFGSLLLGRGFLLATARGIRSAGRWSAEVAAGVAAESRSAQAPRHWSPVAPAGWSKASLPKLANSSFS